MMWKPVTFSFLIFSVAGFGVMTVSKVCCLVFPEAFPSVPS